MAFEMKTHALRSGSNNTPENTLNTVAINVREYLSQKFPAVQGFKTIETVNIPGNEPALGSVSYFSPMSAIKYKMRESEKDGTVKFEVFSGKTSGAEITIRLDEVSNQQLSVKVAWMSEVYNLLTNIAIGLAVLVTGIVIISTCVEKYQQGSWTDLIMYIVLPWKFLWMGFLSLMITSIPAMLVAWIISKGIYTLSSKNFNANELEAICKDIANILNA